MIYELYSLINLALPGIDYHLEHELLALFSTHTSFCPLSSCCGMQRTAACACTSVYDFDCYALGCRQRYSCDDDEYAILNVVVFTSACM